MESEPPTPSAVRSKASRTRSARSPAPDYDLPPHERFLFQNRPGPVVTSDHSLQQLSLLTHEDYFEHINGHVDGNEGGKAYLNELHERAFPQWEFELVEGFNLCLYGYGSKRNLVAKFADWVHHKYAGFGRGKTPTIVMVNGYMSDTNLRQIFSTIARAIAGPDEVVKGLPGNAEALETIRSLLDEHPPAIPLKLFINSIDAPALRRPLFQSLLSQLACHRSIHLLATADTPNFPLLWDMNQRDNFSFAFHDCTTFESYSAAEINVVDEVNSLLGRKARRIGGKDGIGFVLRSLPDNTRKLYRLLITEVLTIMGEQQQLAIDGGDDEDDYLESPQKAKSRQRSSKRQKPADAETFVELRALYHKASEEFISSSEMMFRTQLKEFYDHQMIIARTDPSGMEMLGVPLSCDEMESVLDDLIMD